MLIEELTKKKTSMDPLMHMIVDYRPDGRILLTRRADDDAAAHQF